MKRIVLALAAILTPLAAFSVAQATIVRSMSLNQMAKEADVVVHARVATQTSSWNDTKSRIYTVTNLEVVDTLKGDKAKTTLQVRQIGGTVDGITQSIVGNANLKVGEEVVLFLDSDEKLPFHYVIGMAQGKYSIDRSAGEPRVARSLAGLALADVKGDRAQLKPDDGHTVEAATGLDAFKTTVRAAISGQ